MDKQEIIKNVSNNDSIQTTKKTSKKAVKCIPSMPFEDAFIIAKGIWECASGQKVRRITLFDHLGKSPESGPSRSLITASSKYGLTAGGYQAEYLELTETGSKAVNPDSPFREALLAKFQLAIQSNSFFEHLYDTYKSMKLPTNKVMEDCVTEFGLEEHEAKQCVETFIVNAKYVGLIKTFSGAQRIITIEHLIEETDQSHLSDVSHGSETAKLDISTRKNDSITADTTNRIEYDKICFYITPIGEDGSEQRKHSDMLLECIVIPVLEQYDLKAVRTDQIDKPGIITHQILDYITKSKMVIADLSYHNPNVFYELAVRHMKGLPAIHISRSADKIPFDIGNFRTVSLDMTDIYSFVPQIETYKSQISSQLRSLLDANGEADNPISSYLNR